MEGIAIHRVCQLFHAKYANVQLHSGSQANMGAYGALLSIGDTILEMSLVAGLHSNPMEYADVVTSTTHKTLRGPRRGIILTNREDIAKK